jgi:hypothetical protein
METYSILARLTFLPILEVACTASADKAVPPMGQGVVCLLAFLFE